MLKAAANFSAYQFVLAGVRNLPAELYTRVMGESKIKIIFDKTYELLWIAEAALVKSGTSTLEAALIGTPEVVCYSGDPISIAIARLIVDVKYISLVNLIMDRPVVKELLQEENNPEKISEELAKIIKGGSGRELMLSEYSELSKMLGPAGASDRIALEMVKLLKKSLAK